MIAAFTSRSQAYAQAIETQKITITGIITFGKKETVSTDKTDFQLKGTAVFMPDLNIPLIETIHKNNWIHKHINSQTINNPTVIEEIQVFNPDLIIYSGYGGQIIDKKILEIGIPFIHIHSGWLPDYRGSTTMYYSWIKEKTIGVSAIVMSPQIDMGNILMKAQYPLPSKEINLDYLYDPAIRADLLICLLKEYYRKGCLPEGKIQNNRDGIEYYVIHPILKHLALLTR